MRAAAASFSLILASAGLTLAPARRCTAADALVPRIPTAKLTQQVGLAQIAIEYDCPAVQGRKIWGGVVPYDRPWVIGGNSGAKVKFSKDVHIGDRVVPSGSYSLLALPGKSDWTLMLNKESGGASRAYKPELDVLRIRVLPRSTARHERLLFTFSNINDDRASLDLEWDTVRVSLPIQVDTTQQILASISGLDGTWRAFSNAARYMLETAKDYDAGLKYIDQALALKDDWYSMWVKGTLFAAKGDYRSAREWAVRARDLAQQAGNGAALAPDLDKAIAEWTHKGGGRPDGEAQALKKVGDDSTTGNLATTNVATANVTTAQEGPSMSPPAPVFKTVQDVPQTTAPTFMPTPEKESSRQPAGDPPLARRARLRRR